MVFLLLVSVLFSQTPYLLLIDGIDGRGKIKMGSASTPSINEPATAFILVHTEKLKPMIKGQISVKLVSSGISHILGSLQYYSDKTRLKKLMIMIIIIMNKSQETTVFHGRQILTSAMN